MKYTWMMMALGLALQVNAQKKNRKDPGIDIKEVSRIEKTLSADDMEGRRIFTPGIEKAANFIAAEFQKIGLEKLPAGNSYLQTFKMLKPSQQSAAVTVNGKTLDDKSFLWLHPKRILSLPKHPALNWFQSRRVAILCRKPMDMFLQVKINW